MLMYTIIAVESHDEEVHAAIEAGDELEDELERHPTPAAAPTH
jgi:hypothetical protein